MAGRLRGTAFDMRLMRGAVAIGVAKRIYTEARKPENQRRIKQAVDSFQARRARGRTAK